MPFIISLVILLELLGQVLGYVEHLQWWKELWINCVVLVQQRWGGMDCWGELARLTGASIQPPCHSLSSTGSSPDQCQPNSLLRSTAHMISIIPPTHIATSSSIFIPRIFSENSKHYSWNLVCKVPKFHLSTKFVKAKDCEWLRLIWPLHSYQWISNKEEINNIAAATSVIPR